MRTPQTEWDETNWAERELSRSKFKQILKLQSLQMNQDKTYCFGVFRKDDGMLIGEVRLMDISRGVFQNAYLGYRIFNNHWRQGYAQEACLAIMNIAFKKLKLHRIEAGIEPHNKRSIKTAKKIGLRKEGLSLRRLKFRGKWIDLLIFAITKEEY
jgi:ribosomal-protein-alanine N-acetyltransferase